jgi:hypothetical protein
MHEAQYKQGRRAKILASTLLTDEKRQAIRNQIGEVHWETWKPDWSLAQSLARIHNVDPVAVLNFLDERVRLIIDTATTANWEIPAWVNFADSHINVLRTHNQNLKMHSPCPKLKKETDMMPPPAPRKEKLGPKKSSTDAPNPVRFKRTLEDVENAVDPTQQDSSPKCPRVETDRLYCNESLNSPIWTECDTEISPVYFQGVHHGLTEEQQQYVLSKIGVVYVHSFRVSTHLVRQLSREIGYESWRIAAFLLLYIEEKKVIAEFTGKVLWYYDELIDMPASPDSCDEMEQEKFDISLRKLFYEDPQIGLFE